jgi:hypothetical protein
MRTEMTEKGWKETTVKYFNIVSFHKHLPDMTTKDWLECSRKLRLTKGMRSHCPCCKIKWENISGKINSIMTDKGNQCVCDICFNELGGNV